MLSKELNNIKLNEVLDIRKSNFIFEYNLKKEIKDIKKYIFILISDLYKLKYFKKDYKILNDKDINARYRYKIFEKSKIIIYTFDYKIL